MGFPLLIIHSNSWGKLFAILLGLSGVIVLVFGLILFLKKWEDRNKANYRLAPFYIELFIFYSLAYTFASVASPDGGFISGLHPIIESGKTYKDASLLAVYYQIPHLFLDSIYYCVMIMTTLGDGSIQPKNILKMVVISHVGFTFYITVFGVAEYFSNQSSKELKKELEILKLDLIDTKQEKYSPPTEEKNNKKAASISKRFYISFKGFFTGRYV
jgi:hypothetical protein